MSAHAPSANSAPYKLLRIYGEPINTTIDFALPNMRFEQIRCGPYWFSSRATVTPIRRDLCRIDFVAAWNIDRKSTRLNSSHLVISYAVFCLKKKKKTALLISSAKRIVAVYVSIRRHC